MNAALAKAFLIHSTAGAIPVRNEKGEISMQKVKVHRYVSGKRPEYAPQESSDEENEEEFLFDRKKAAAALPVSESVEEGEKDDPRLRRLLQTKSEVENEEIRIERHRHIHGPEILARGEESEEEEEPEQDYRHRRIILEDEESSEEEELDEEEIERRRNVIRQKLKSKAQEVELMDLEDDMRSEEDESEEESSGYEEYTDSEEESGPRLKPVFVRKRDRVTVQEKEKEELHKKELEQEAKKLAEERRKQTLKLVEEETRKELAEKQGILDPNDLVITDDENDEAEYESWKVRELKRIKRDREERETIEKERLEIERMHNLTEEERRAELRQNPKLVTNKAIKGKYKFLQKYYHRGAFYMDVEDEVFKRDFAQPTLEDHFDKTILPKVMQVKNFGRSGRTKYTHLVDQDTTIFDSPWASETAQNLKFHSNQAGGMKQMFDRPSAKKRKK